MRIEFYDKMKKLRQDFLEVPIQDITIDEEYISLKDKSIEDITITESFKDSLFRMVGVSPSLSNSLHKIDKDLWSDLLVKLYTYYDKNNIIILLNEIEGKYFTKGLCNTTRKTISSTRFIEKVVSHVEIESGLFVDDVIYSNESLKSNVVILSEEKYFDFYENEYQLGFVVYNDEIYNSYCRSILKKDNVLYYLPSKFYNLSTSRYDKTTDGAEESLDVMMLRVLEDFTSGFLNDLQSNINLPLDKLSKLNYSYQEYLELNSIVMNICIKSEVGDIEFIKEMLDSINDFEDNYGEVRNDYLWKCTAFSNYTFDKFLEIIKQVETNAGIMPEDITDLREYAGNLIYSKKMSEVVADVR